MIVHDIEVHDIRTGIQNRLDVVTKPREVGGENGGGDKRLH
jgi:hypothetical protein